LLSLPLTLQLKLLRALDFNVVALEVAGRVCVTLWVEWHNVWFLKSRHEQNEEEMREEGGA
jgi:hypothetical protein